MTHPSAEIDVHEQFAALLTAVLNDVEYFTEHDRLASVCIRLLAIHTPDDEGNPELPMAKRYRRLVVACLDWAETPTLDLYAEIQWQWKLYTMSNTLSKRLE